MKFKTILLVIMFLLVFSNIISFTATSLSDKNYKLTVESCEYDLIKTVGGGPQTTFDYYKVAFTLANEGPEDSDKIIVSIQESRESDREKLYRSGVVPAGESKTFYFGYTEMDNTQWILQATNTGKNYRHKVFVNYFPDENTSIPSEFNSGNYTFLIGATTSNDSPGFEIVFFIGALIAIFVLKKKKRKK